MEINSTQANQNIAPSKLASAKSTQTGVERLAEQKTPTSTDNVGDIDKTTTRDNVSLSAESLKLAKTSTTTQNVKTTAQITDRQQAQDLVGQLVSNIQSQPNQAQTTFGRISQTQVSSLLA